MLVSFCVFYELYQSLAAIVLFHAIMRRIRLILYIFSIGCLIGTVFYCYPKDSAGIGFVVSSPGQAYIYDGENDIWIHGWEKNSVLYFFLPSYINIKQLDYSLSELKIYDKTGRLLDRPRINSTEEISIGHSREDSLPYRVGIYQSKNLYTIEIQLDPGCTTQDIDHDLYMSADIRIVSPTGHVLIDSFDSDEPSSNTIKCRIKGRGNSSWDAGEKRPYEIKLCDKVTIGNVGTSDKWTLLSNTMDKSMMINKLVYDTAKDIGMSYTIASDWVDLYINNEYRGVYLLCQEPNIGGVVSDKYNLQKINNAVSTNRIPYSDSESKGYIYDDVQTNTEGGYLIEKNIDNIYQEKECGFIIDGDYMFTSKSPDNASREQLEYISELCDRLNKSIRSSVLSEKYQYVDKISFAKKALISEVFLNPDSYLTSDYYYKLPGKEVLFSGPCWDFDKAWGASERSEDYTETTFDITDGEDLDWSYVLLKDSGFRSYLYELYCGYHSKFEQMDRKIDSYSEQLSSAQAMNNIRWDIDDSETATLKDWLKNRLDYLDKHAEWLQ